MRNKQNIDKEFDQTSGWTTMSGLIEVLNDATFDFYIEPDGAGNENKHKRPRSIHSTGQVWVTKLYTSALITKSGNLFL